MASTPYHENERIPVATVVAVYMFICLLLDAFLLFFNFVKRYTKNTEYLVLCNLGALFFVSQEIYHIFPLDVSPKKNGYFTHLFYYVGFPMMYIPILVRSWRIVCFYRRTIDLHRCRWSDLMRRRRRGNKWLLLRFFILIFPFIIFWLFLNLDVHIPEYFCTTFNAMNIIFMLAVTAMHIRLRKQLAKYDLNESTWLVVFNLYMIMYWIWDTVGFYHFTLKTHNDREVYISKIAVNMGLSCITILPKSYKTLRKIIRGKKRKVPKDTTATSPASDTTSAEDQKGGGQIDSISVELETTTHHTTAPTGADQMVFPPVAPTTTAAAQPPLERVSINSSDVVTSASAGRNRVGSDVGSINGSQDPRGPSSV